MITIVLIVFFAALALFSITNWNTFTASTNLQLLFTSVHAPLGLILLGFVALISLMFMIYILYIQASQMGEMKRLNREMKSLRDLAEQAEASRMKDLNDFLKAEMTRLAGKADESHASLQQHMEHRLLDLRTLIEQTGNSLAASIEEMDDRLTKK